LRRQGLTASDIVTLSGTVPFKKTKTRYDVYLDKVHPELVKPTEITEAMELGHETEPVIVVRAARKRGLGIVYPHTTVRHPDIEWAMATPDALVVDSSGSYLGVVAPGTGKEEGLIEAKLVGVHVADCWGEIDDVEHGPPDYVYTQVVWQLFVKQLPYCIVAAMIGTEFRTYRIEFDDGAQEYARALVEIGEKFLVDHVRPRRPPPVDGSESSRQMLATLFQKPTKIVLKANNEDEHAARVYFEAKKQRDAGQQMMDNVKTAMMAKIQNAYGIYGDGWRAAWPSQKGYHVDAYDVEPMRKFDLRDLREKKR
jgi:putative phage-type endonuclease